jgi:hypothetical protein
MILVLAGRLSIAVVAVCAAICLAVRVHVFVAGSRRRGLGLVPRQRRNGRFAPGCALVGVVVVFGRNWLVLNAFGHFASFAIFPPFVSAVLLVLAPQQRGTPPQTPADHFELVVARVAVLVAEVQPPSLGAGGDLFAAFDEASILVSSAWTDVLNYRNSV